MDFYDENILMQLSVLKDREHYEENKKRFNKKYNEIYKRISGQGWLGCCSLLYDKIQPETYQDFFNEYTQYRIKLGYGHDKAIDEIQKGSNLSNCALVGESLKGYADCGRTIPQLIRLAECYRAMCGNYEIPLESYFDDLVCHAIIETFDGKIAERIYRSYVEGYGFEVLNTSGFTDSVGGVDLIIKKNDIIFDLIQVKPSTTFLGDVNKSLVSDRKYFFEKRNKLFNHYKENGTKISDKCNDINYVIYDKDRFDNDRNNVMFYVNDRTGKFKFKLSELCDENGFMITDLNDKEIKEIF